MRLDFETILSPLVVTDTGSHAVNNVKKLLDDGIKSAQAGDRIAARSFLLEAVEADQRCELGWLWLASISEYPEELLAFLNNVLEINPANRRALDWSAATRSLLARTYVQRGIDASKSEQKDFAGQCFEKALSYDEKNQMAWLWLASLTDVEEKKLELLERAVAIDSENEAVQSALRISRQKQTDSMLIDARSAVMTGNRQKAIEILDRFIERIPASEEAWMLRAQVAEEFEAKTLAFERVLEINPDNGAARAGLDSLKSAIEPLPVEKPFASPVQLHDDFAAKPTGDVFGGNFVQDDHPTQELEFPKAMIEEYGLDAANMTVLPEPDSLPDVTGYFDPGTFNAPAVEHELPVTVFEPVADTDHIEPWIPVTETDPSSDVIDQPENESYPAVNIPYSEAAEWDEAAIGTEETVDDIKPARLSPVSVCPFCRHENSPHAVRCDGCLAVLTLSDLEMLLSNRECRSDLIEKVTEKMEAERVVRQLHEDELVTLGIGHLNLKNLDIGFSVLRDASQANPNNVILGSQVNALAIRLEEIKNQPETNGAALLAKAILVVDDSMTVRKLISGKLEKNGHKVVCAEDGADAIAVLENFVPDLVLLDIDMPKMDGYQVCKLIRSKSATKDVPVIMISGKDGFFDKVRGKMAGSTDHISKPFGPETLMKALENYLSDVVPQQ